MKARSVLVAVCVVLWMASDSNCEDPRETYKKWAGIVETLKKKAVADGDRVTECSATPEQTLSYYYSKFNLFDKRKYTGVMNYAWPRLSFYTEVLKALTEAPSLDDIVLCASATYGQRVCVVNKCKNCLSHKEEIDDAKLKEICDYTYAKPPVEAELTEEMRKELAAILKPPVESPGELTAEEAFLWMEAKLLENKTDVAEKEGDDCNASPQLTMSLSYLRMMVLFQGATTLEAVEAELKAHPEFYPRKLRWLKGADKEIVPCDGGLGCGWDGVCLNCGMIFYQENLYLKEACNLESIYVPQPPSPPRPRPPPPPPPTPTPTPTKYGNPLEAYRSWVTAFAKVKKSSVVKKSANKSCSASVGQTISYAYLTGLFYEHQTKGVMRQAWPRISFYEQKLGEVEKAPEDVVFCDWELGKEETFLCVDGTCKECRKKTESWHPWYLKRCLEQLNSPPSEANLPRQKEVEEMRRIDVEVEEPKGVLTLEEALAWKEKFEKKSGRELLEECDVPPQLTFSQKFLVRRLLQVKEAEEEEERWRTKEEVKAEMAAYQETFDEKLKWLKGVAKTRVFCGDNLVCSFEGVCVPCEVAKVTKNKTKSQSTSWDNLREACELEIATADKSGGGGRVGGGGKWGAVTICFFSMFCVSFLNY